jgi:hypothetical protein
MKKSFFIFFSIIFLISYLFFFKSKIYAGCPGTFMCCTGTYMVCKKDTPYGQVFCEEGTPDCVCIIQCDGVDIRNCECLYDYPAMDYPFGTSTICTNTNMFGCYFILSFGCVVNSCGGGPVTPSPTPIPTLPPGCTCGGWVDRGCRPDKCTSPNLHRYTRTCTPDACASQAKCEYDPACLAPTPTPGGPGPGPGPGPSPGEPFCTITSLPLSVRVNEGRTSRFEAIVSYQNATGVNRVEFSSSNTSIVTVNPSSDSSSPYETIVTGVAQGSASLFVDAFLDPSGGCTTSVPITVTLPDAWFQTRGGDVHSQGNLSSNIPPTATNPNFSLELNNYPGIISHQSFGGAYFGEGYPSNSEAGHWLAESKYEGKPYSSFEFFKKKYAMQMIEENFDGNLPQANGVYYSKSLKTLSGNWTVPASRWLVILVEGEVTIPNDIKVNEGGFLAIASSGNIIFDSSVTKAQGIFIADGKIDTGSGSTAFEGQGVFATSDFELNRDFADIRNKTTPVETFIARPDFVMSSYKDADNNLWWFYQKWQELAP